MGAVSLQSRFSTSAASPIKSISVRPHVGQDIISGPRFRMPRARKISYAAMISCVGSAVKDTRKVSPIPSHNKIPSPTADLTPPRKRPPASVMPICKG